MTKETTEILEEKTDSTRQVRICGSQNLALLQQGRRKSINCIKVKVAKSCSGC